MKAATDPLFPDAPPADMERTATISGDRRYRYDLTRRWADGPTLTWVLLNPSTANAAADDPTLRRVIGFSRAAGAGRAAVVNVFALRTPDTTHLVRAPDPVGPSNDVHLRSWAGERAERVVVGWGALTLHRWAHKDRPAQVLALLEQLRPDGLWCVGETNAGHPRHPLYVKAAVELQRYR